jgi:hypothetical protein
MLGVGIQKRNCGLSGRRYALTMSDGKRFRRMGHVPATHQALELNIHKAEQQDKLCSDDQLNQTEPTYTSL